MRHVYTAGPREARGVTEGELSHAGTERWVIVFREAREPG